MEGINVWWVLHICHFQCFGKRYRLFSRIKNLRQDEMERTGTETLANVQVQRQIQALVCLVSRLNLLSVNCSTDLKVLESWAGPGNEARPFYQDHDR